NPARTAGPRPRRTPPAPRGSGCAATAGAAATALPSRGCPRPPSRSDRLGRRRPPPSSCALRAHAARRIRLPAHGRGEAMERVTGIGGVFFRSKDPVALAAWYRDHLGFQLEPADEEVVSIFRWAGQGSTTWSPFPRDTTYFDPSASSLMI